MDDVTDPGLPYRLGLNEDVGAAYEEHLLDSRNALLTNITMSLSMPFCTSFRIYLYKDEVRR